MKAQSSKPKAPRISAIGIANLLARVLAFESVWVVFSMRVNRSGDPWASDWHTSQAHLSRLVIRQTFGSDSRQWPKSVREIIRGTIRRSLENSPLPAA